MNCETVQNWLYRAEGLDPSYWSADVGDHMQTCAVCNSLAYDLLKLEEKWRRQPVPPECESAKASFLQSLPAHCRTPQPKLLAVPGRRWRPKRWAAAAAVLLVCGLIWQFAMPSRLQASPDLIEELIDWNVQLTEIDGDDRHRLFAEHEPMFRLTLTKHERALSREDRDLAFKLLENGQWLATNSDPVAQANKFSDLRDHLIVTVESAAQTGDERRSQRYANCYQKVIEKALNPILLKLAQPKMVEGPKRAHLDDFVKREQEHHKQLEKVLRQVPAAFQNLRKTLDAGRHGFRGPQHLGGSRKGH